VAILLGCSKEHVRHLIEEGSLTAVDVRCVGTSRPAHRIVQASLVAFVQKRKTV
jgi:excisionase family DNA binding protein